MNRLLWLLAALASGCSLFNQELPNEPPRLEVSTADTLRVVRGGRVSFQVSASDNDDDPLGYLWSAFGAGTFTDSASNITDWRAPEKIQGNSRPGEGRSTLSRSGNSPNLFRPGAKIKSGVQK